MNNAFLKNPVLFGCMLVMLVGLLALTGCGGAAGAAPDAVEAYLDALVSKDANRLSALSCAAWEPEARQELESFGAVEARLEDVACQEAGQDGDSTLVSCSGAIVANYNGEDQEFALAERTFVTVDEGGEWRMCGYR